MVCSVWVGTKLDQVQVSSAETQEVQVALFERHRQVTQPHPPTRSPGAHPAYHPHFTVTPNRGTQATPPATLSAHLPPRSLVPRSRQSRAHKDVTRALYDLKSQIPKEMCSCLSTRIQDPRQFHAPTWDSLRPRLGCHRALPTLLPQRNTAQSPTTSRANFQSSTGSKPFIE